MQLVNTYKAYGINWFESIIRISIPHLYPIPRYGEKGLLIAGVGGKVRVAEGLVIAL